MKCDVCGKERELISKELGVCLDCIRHHFHSAKKHVEEAHKRCREEHKLPVHPPRDKDGILCDICVNQCRIGKGNTGFCAVRKNNAGKLEDFGGATLNWHHEKLPASCAADNVCAGCTGAGYPEYAYNDGPETGRHILSVFYGACSYDCLFCQNWHFRDFLVQPHVVTPEELAMQVDEKTSCVCFMGGDPTPQIYHTLASARLMLEKKKGRILRICFETNGSMNEAIAREMADLSLRSGGTIKVDLKAHNDDLHYSLTGVSNKWTLKNIKMISEIGRQRGHPPLLEVSTLLVPGYIDAQEIGEIARFLAGIDKGMPYTLMAFYPQFYMYDLPPTSKRLAEDCLKAAKNAGMKNVFIGNKHLLI